MTFTSKDSHWYKTAQTAPWLLDATGREYSEMSIEDLDRAAFGFSRTDKATMSPEDVNNLNIKWGIDQKEVEREIRESGLSSEDWAFSVDLENPEDLADDPITVSYEDGEFWIEEGHHRVYAAKILGKGLNNVNVIMKDNPHRAIVDKALKSGDLSPEDYDRIHAKVYGPLESFHQKWVYHGTSEGAFRKIREFGMTDPVNYFSDDEVYAQSYADRKGNGERLLRIPYSEDMVIDESNEGGDYKVPGLISPLMIEVKVGNDWIPIRKYENMERNIMPLSFVDRIKKNGSSLFRQKVEA